MSSFAIRVIDSMRLSLRQILPSDAMPRDEFVARNIQSGSLKKKVHITFETKTQLFDYVAFSKLARNYDDNRLQMKLKDQLV